MKRIEREEEEEELAVQRKEVEELEKDAIGDGGYGGETYEEVASAEAYAAQAAPPHPIPSPQRADGGIAYPANPRLGGGGGGGGGGGPAAYDYQQAGFGVQRPVRGGDARLSLAPSSKGVSVQMRAL